MSKRLELTGRQFGRLTVLGMASWRYSGGTVWHCECQCGKKADVVSWSLTSGGTRSCGCLQRERAIEQGRRMGTARWQQRCAGRDYPPSAIEGYVYDATLTPGQQRAWARELSRVAAHEGEPARENFRRRAWLNPHLRPALPAESKAVAA